MQEGRAIFYYIANAVDLAPQIRPPTYMRVIQSLVVCD